VVKNNSHKILAILSTLIFCSVSLSAMKHATTIWLALSPYVRISVSQVKNVTKRIDEYSERYEATSSNGDSASCSRYFPETQSNRIFCSCFTIDKDGFMKEFSLDKENFYILKKLYEQSQSDVSQ